MASLVRGEEGIRSDRFSQFWEARFWPNDSPTLDQIDEAIRPYYVYRDEREEVLRTPLFMVNDLETIGKFEGDCDDISILTAAVCTLFGYRARFVAIRYDPSVDYIQHVFVQAMDSYGWRVLDLTVPIGTKLSAIEIMVQDV